MRRTSGLPAMRLYDSCFAATSAVAACHGTMLMPSPFRTIALMISTFSVSMITFGRMPPRLKKSSTS